MAAFHTFPARLTPELHPLGDSGLRLLPMEYSEAAYLRRFLPGAAADDQAGSASSSSSRLKMRSSSSTATRKESEGQQGREGFRGSNVAARGKKQEDLEGR